MCIFLLLYGILGWFGLCGTILKRQRLFCLSTFRCVSRTPFFPDSMPFLRTVRILQIGYPSALSRHKNTTTNNNVKKELWVGLN